MGVDPEPTPLPPRAARPPLEQTSAHPATPGEGRPGGRPERVGPYRLLRELGRGGMGVVYLAVRDDLPQRYVALKLIHRGMAVGEVLERFERERAALAALNHPNIARLLDGGTGEHGEPWFVMEYVEGRPIDEYCDGRRLTIQERLRLFRRICEAVHHAHQHLVVHRDIKPRNILVSAEGEPKLLDFGIAKLLNPALGPARDAPTETGLRIMTPEYASPEQIRGEPVTTSSDVYSLGVVLFELLTGRRPYRLRTRVWKELERVICEEDPERPSTAITRVDDAAEASTEAPAEEPGYDSSAGSGRTPEVIGRARGERPLRLRKALEGDLDNIVLKALRKEPQRRYGSALELGEDLRRHLEGLPVTARPDTFVYRASKFVRRHRGGVTGAGVVLAAILAGAAAALWQARIAGDERDAAEAAAQRAEDARVETQRALEAVEAEQARQREIARRAWLEISPRFAEEGGSVGARLALVELCESVYTELARSAAADDADFWREFAGGRLRSGILLRGVRGAGVGDVQRALREFESASREFARLAAGQPDDVESTVGWIRADTLRADLLQMSFGRVEEAAALLDAADRRANDLLGRSRVTAVVDAAAAAAQLRGDVEFKRPPAETAMERARPHWDVAGELRRERLRADPRGADATLDPARRLYVPLLIRRAVLEGRADPGAPGVAKALEALEEAEALARPMFERDPGEPRNRRTLAGVLAARGDLLRRSDRDAEAIAPLGEAIALTLPLLADPDDGDARRTVIDQRTTLGLAYLHLDRLEDAEIVLALADDGAADLLERTPEDVLSRRRAAAAAMALGEARVRAGAQGAAAPLARACALWRALDGGSGSFRPSLAKSLVLLGDASAAGGDGAAARQAWVEAIPLLEAMAADPAFAGEPEVGTLLERARTGAGRG